MATPVYQIGRTGRIYAAVEATYGVAPGFAATDAIRNLTCALNSKLRNRVNAPTRHSHPSQVYRYTRRGTATWSLSGEFFPSGTINTLPDHSDILEHGIGTKRSVVLSTTVAASPSPTTTVFTVASVTGLAVNDPVLIQCTGGVTPGLYVRWITAINTLALTVAPALPQAPVSTNTVKGCIGYTPATALTSALNIGKYLTSLSYQGYGCVVDELKLSFDANSEVMWTASGPMMKRVRNAATADPGTFTVVGSTPPSGLTGGLVVNGTAEDMVKAELTIANAMALDNFAAGTSLARGFYRKGKRAVSLGVDAMVTDDVTIITVAEANSDATVLIQCGDTEGSIIALYCPIAEADEPDDPDNDEEMEWKYKFTAKSVIAGNQEFFLAVA